MTVESASRADWHASKPLKRGGPSQMCTAAFPLPAWPPARPSGRQSQLQEASDRNPQQFSPDKLQFFPLRLNGCFSCDEVAIVLDWRTTGFLSPPKRRQKPGEGPVISFHLWSACLQTQYQCLHKIQRCRKHRRSEETQEFWRRWKTPCRKHTSTASVTENVAYGLKHFVRFLSDLVAVKLVLTKPAPRHSTILWKRRVLLPDFHSLFPPFSPVFVLLSIQTCTKICGYFYFGK